VNKLITGQQLYRPIDANRVTALSEVLLEKENRFYQPICVMIRGVSKEQFTNGDKMNLVRK